MELLRQHDDLRRLWFAQTISLIGGQFTFLALPLTAAVLLQATPAQMGLLAAMDAIPSLLVGLFAGEIVDRRPRRPILISADLMRAVLLAAIPLAWFANCLSMPLLFLVALLAGSCSLFFDIANQAYVPSLLDRQHLLKGNSLLELSRSAAEVIGPAIAGGLIQIVKAPLAMVIDAGSFLASAFLISRIQTPELPRETPVPGRFWHDAFAGIREIGGSSPLRALAASLAAIGLFNAMIEAVWILYLTRTVGLDPAVLGLVFAIGSAGFVVGATLPTRLVHLFGIGPTLAGSILVVGLSDLALPFAGHDVYRVAVAVALGQFCFGLGLTVFRVAQISIRQAIVPHALLGRVGGAFTMFGWGVAPLGAVAGGLLGQAIGLWWILLLGALLETATAVGIGFSPLWSFRDIPVQDQAAD